MYSLNYVNVMNILKNHKIWSGPTLSLIFLYPVTYDGPLIRLVFVCVELCLIHVCLHFDVTMVDELKSLLLDAADVLGDSGFIKPLMSVNLANRPGIIKVITLHY